MRVVLDGRFYRTSTGGIGRYTRELINNLLKIDKNNQYILVITPADAAECRVAAANFRKVIIPITHFTTAEQLKLPALLTQLKPDLTHFLNFNHPILYSRRPYIITVHDLTMNFFPVGRQQSNPLRRFAYLQVMRHAVLGPDAVIVPTETVKKDLIKHLGASANKIHVTYESADIPPGIFARPKPAYLKEQFKITKPYLLFVSQWRPHKGLGVLVEAFNRVKVEHDVQLVVTGQAQANFPEIPAAIKASPYRTDIITPGFVDDEALNVLYAAAELFVFPSWYEGFGLPPLEAMARGVAVAASNTSVMPEILGAAAAYFDPRNSKNMAKTINDLLDDDERRRQLQEKALVQAKKYSWEKMAKETLALYETLIKKYR